MKNLKLPQNLPNHPALTALLLVGVGILYSDFSLLLSAKDGVSWGGDPMLFVMNTIPVLLMLGLVWLMTGLSWLACLLTGVVVFLITGGNYFKLLFRDDPLVWGDLSRIREGLGMSDQYHVTFTPLMWVWILVIIAATAILVLLGRGRPKATLRFLALTAVGMVAVGCFFDLYPDRDRYAAFAGEHAGSETEAYIACGVVYPFFHSAGGESQWAYDQRAAEKYLAQFADEDIPAEKQVDFITIQLEAFCDLSAYGVKGLSPDVYANFHTLLDHSYHGTLITDIFAGGTTETEWAVLTGGNLHGDFSHPTDSVAWYFRDQGYTVNGSHPCLEWFYDRAKVNPNLGFEDYLFTENYYRAIGAIKETDDVAYDDVYFPDLEKRLGAYFAENDTPLFSFNVTYQGHGPYRADKTYWGNDFCKGGYSKSSDNILNNYFFVVQNTMEHMAHFTRFLNTVDRPIVLTLYGDHKPWLGDQNSVYEELGVNLDTTDPEGFWNYYATWYLVWANDKAKEVLDFDFQGTGKVLSPCFLMDHVLGLCGLKGSAYLQAQHEVAEALPVLHTTGWYMENGDLSPALSPAGQAMVERFQNLSRWDRENGR